MLLPLLSYGGGGNGTEATAAPAAVEEEALEQLLTVRRVYIDRLSGGETAAQMRDMIAASLQSAKLFVITENPDRADATLRGSAEDLVFTDVHSSSDSIRADSHFGFGKATQPPTAAAAATAGAAPATHSAISAARMAASAWAIASPPTAWSAGTRPWPLSGW